MYWNKMLKGEILNHNYLKVNFPLESMLPSVHLD